MRQKPRASSCLLLTLFGSLAPVPAFGQEADTHFVVHASSEEAEVLRLDGLLLETLWDRAIPIASFRQQEPEEGQDASERTEVRVALDGVNLYVGVQASDSEPDRIVSRILQRDRLMELDFTGTLRFAGDDAVAILLDPFHDHRSGFVFATNPNGAEFEALLTDEGRQLNVDWRAVWEVAATRTPEGWSAEFSIPLRTLRYPDESGGGTWGFNVTRIIRRKNEVVLWRSWSRDNEGFVRVSRAGHLAGLTDLPRTELNLEIKPYVLASARQELDDAGKLPSDGQMEVGLDLKTEVVPGLALDLTVNTDFAQVEVDDEQVNLTRFDLFFPEKRDFFLENAGIFEFGTTGAPGEPLPPFQLFFSRQIGIDDDGAVPIIGGARLTGRVGRQTVGLLDVVTDETPLTPRTNFAVARMKRDVGERDYLGWMVTDRRDAINANTTAGIDGSLWLSPTVNLQGFYVQMATQGEGGDDHAYRLGVDYASDRFGLFSQHLMVGDEAEAGVGFITRTDLRQTDLFGRFTPRPDVLGLRKVDLWVGGRYLAGVDGTMQDWSVTSAVAPEWESGDRVLLFGELSRTRLDESFDLADSIPIEPGTYANSRVGWFGGTSAARALSLNQFVTAQQFYGGRLFAVSTTLNVAASPRLSFATAYTRNDVDVSNGSFIAHIGSVRASYSFSTRAFTNVLVQYNSLDGAFTTNVRFNFIHRPGSDFFVVFTEERGIEGALWSTSDRGLVLKLTYLSRL